MPVVNTPSVSISVPVPTPVQAKPKQPKPVAAPPQPQAQPAPVAPAPMMPPQPQMSALILPWSPSPKKMRRLPTKVIKFAAHHSDIRALFKAVRSNPYDETLHGVLADALEEQGVTHIPELIRSMFPTLGGTRENNYYQPVENSWDGTFPYTAYLGEHGPFDLYLGHEQPTSDSHPVWVVHAIAQTNQHGTSMRHLNDTGYSFEFPHEEAHLIPRMFPAAAKYINPGDFTTPRSGSPPGLQHFRDMEARQFSDKIDQQERERDEERAQDRYYDSGNGPQDEGG